MKPKRRKRSELSRQDCLKVFERFAMTIRRFGETSDEGMFALPSGEGCEPMGQGDINVQLCVKGGFGSADQFFEAIRVLGGFKLPRNTQQPLRRNGDV